MFGNVLDSDHALTESHFHRLLTMPNGDRIQFDPNVNFIFETHDLSYASPATVSRMGMIFVSEEDLDFDAIADEWAQSLPEERRRTVRDWVSDHLKNAIAFVQSASDDVVVSQSQLGLMRNGLSQLLDVTNKASFATALLRGIGGSLTYAKREELGRAIFDWVRESPPNPRRLLDCYVNSRGDLATYAYNDEVSLTREDVCDGALVLTSDAQRTVDTILPWLQNQESFILVGPEGCGKQTILRHAFSLINSSVATIHCNAQTSADDIQDKIAQCCSVFNSNAGRVYRPNSGDSLILYLKDLNLPKPDKYGTSSLVAFLQQIVTYNGFYDKKLDWIGFESITVVTSMSPSTTLGRTPLSSRFSSVVRVLYLDYSDKDELQAVYNAYLTPVLAEGISGSSEWRSAKHTARLAGSMVTVYTELCDKFSRDEHRHYLFSPRHLTQWCIGLMRYDLDGEDVLSCWVHEA